MKLPDGSLSSTGLLSNNTRRGRRETSASTALIDIVDLEHRVLVGNGLEVRERSAGWGRNVRAPARHLVHIAAKDGRTTFGWDLHQRDRPGATTPQHDLPIGGPDVLHPVALAQHRDQVPPTLDVSHAERVRGQPTRHPSWDLQIDPPLRQQSSSKHPRPVACVPPGGVVAASRRVHVPSVLV